MTTYGNYDAGQSRPISNPLFNGGLRHIDAGQTYDFGFKKVGNTNTGWGVERTTSVTPQERVEADTPKEMARASMLGEEVDNDKFVDEFLSPYITEESRNRMAGTSFTAAMAFGPMDNFLS